MKALLRPDFEDRGQRLTDLATLAIVLVGLIGIFTAETEVPLQFDNHGWSSSAPAVWAAVIYTFFALFFRVAALPSSHPYVRWFGRVMIVFLLVFETVAVLHAS